MPFQIVRNDITKIQLDAIVNTANPSPEDGLGTDAAEEDAIRNSYRSALSVAKAKGLRSIEIPFLASESFGLSKGTALRIALSEIDAFLSASDNDVMVYLVMLDEKTFSLSSELFGDIESYIDNNYVEQKSFEDRCFSNRPQSLGAAETQIDVKATATQKHKVKLKKARTGMFKRECLSESARSLDEVVNNLDKTFMELVFSFADQKGMSDVEVQKKANLDRRTFSKLKCGTTKNPSKSTALAFAVALELNLDDTRDLLSRAGLALSPCSKQDVIVQYFIEKEAYDIYEINVALFEHGEPLLGIPY